MARAEELRRATRDLVNLVPPDSGVVLTVDDLRGEVRELLSSRLADEFRKLPIVKAWLDSEKYEQLENARDQIEGVLQASLAEIRDQILGDGVVVALHLPLDTPVDPQRARGILLFKAGDRALLKRLIDVINTTQKGNGELAAVADREWHQSPYFVREFAARTGRPAEVYASFPDGTFAYSNSESLIHEVIDRKSGKVAGTPAGGSSLGSSASFQALDRRLPERAFLRLFVNPRMVESLLRSGSQTRSPGHELIERYVGAMESAGAALVVRDDRIAIHTAEVLDNRKFHDLLGRVGGGPARSAIQLGRLPGTTLAVVCLDVDFADLYESLVRMVPEADRMRVANVETILRGILLGQDVRSRILPALGPRVLAYVEAPQTWDAKAEASGSPAARWPFPTVFALELRGESGGGTPGNGSGPARPSISAALENALDTLLAVTTLDEKRARGRSRIVSREVAGVAVKSLDPPLPVVFGVDHKGHRLVVGNSANAVSRYLEPGSDTAAGARFQRLHDLAFPEAQSFMCVDLAAVESMIAQHREGLAQSIAAGQARSREEVASDLDRVIDLSKLFDAAYLTNRIDDSSATVYHSIGLLARRADAGTKR
jgi:hypothetical protein